jgi:ubiquinone/menaquinone biosynthesis C-methylase UbiE
MQERIFLESEGDAWFNRNSLIISNANEFHEISWVGEQLESFAHSIQNVLEVGSSSGEKLNTLCGFFSAKGIGIEPSRKAIEFAKSKFASTGLEFHQGTADNLTIDSQSQDLVVAGFCLYLVDEEKIDESLIQLTRVVKPGGFLVITDFDYGQDVQVPYIHDLRIRTFKRDYHKLISRFQNFSLVAKRSFSHSSPNFNLDRDQRISTLIFYLEP